MLTWEAPAALWLGLTLPVVLLLWFLRPRRPRLQVPSLLLWSGSPAARTAARPWQRLRNHPLLWLQLLAALLLTLGAARPFVPAAGAGEHTVVLLDASGSMRATDGGGSRFDAARARVLAAAQDMGPGERLTVVRVDEQPQVLVAGATDAEQVAAVLAAAQPGYGTADAAGALALAAGLTSGPAEWVLVSDGGVTFPAGAALPAGVRWQFWPVGAPAGNVAVARLDIRQGEEGVALQAEIHNTGTAPAAGRLQLQAEGALVSSRPWQADPGARTHVTWTNLPPGPEWYAVRLSQVEAGGNALAHDDTAWVALPRAETPAVLLVSPGNLFLERFFRINEGARTFTAPPADWPGLAAAGRTYPLTVLDRVWPELLPAGNWLVLGPPAGATFRPQSMRLRADHPLLRHVDWSEVHVGSAYALPPALREGWETVIDSDGGPLLAVRADGRQRQAVLAFALGDSDLPLRPAFPVLMANLLDWLLAGPGAPPLTVSPGGAAAVAPLPLAEEVWVEGPDGQRAVLAPPWPPLPFRPPAPGLYRIVQAGPGVRQEQWLVVQGYAATEADLAPREVLPPAPSVAPAPPARRAVAFWPWLAAAVLVVSLAEWWVDARGS